MCAPYGMRTRRWQLMSDFAALIIAFGFLCASEPSVRDVQVAQLAHYCNAQIETLGNVRSIHYFKESVYISNRNDPDRPSYHLISEYFIDLKNGRYRIARSGYRGSSVEIGLHAKVYLVDYDEKGTPGTMDVSSVGKNCSTLAELPVAYSVLAFINHVSDGRTIINNVRTNDIQEKGLIHAVKSSLRTLNPVALSDTIAAIGRGGGEISQDDAEAMKRGTFVPKDLETDWGFTFKPLPGIPLSALRFMSFTSRDPDKTGCAALCTAYGLSSRTSVRHREFGVSNEQGDQKKVVLVCSRSGAGPVETLKEYALLKADGAEAESLFDPSQLDAPRIIDRDSGMALDP